MSFCGAASFYAAAYNISNILGIEYYKQGYTKALEIKESLYTEVGSTSKLRFEQGSFQDFFEADADIVYMDCSQVGPDTMIEEGVLLHSVFFPMCTKLLSGSYLVVVTTLMQLRTSDCAKLGLPCECITHKEIDLSNSNYSEEYRSQFPKHVWILKVSNYKHK